jgi:hypothetical protein
MNEFKLRLSPAGGKDSKCRETTVERVLLCVFIALFVQLIFILYILLITGIAPVFVQKYGFQIDFNDSFIATSDWLNGVDPYLKITVVTPPPSLLVALPLQLFSRGIGRIVFLFINIAIVAASLAGICYWFRMTRREGLLLFGIASIYFPVIFLLERGNLDGIMLGLILVSIFAKNRYITSFGLSLSIGFKVYSILLLASLMLARRWKRVMEVMLLLALLMLPFHSLFWSFIQAQTRRSAELLGAENLCPIGMFNPINVTAAQQHYALSRAVTLVYLAFWLASYAFMLFKNRDSDLKVKAVYSLAWMLAMPLQVFPYTGIMLLPLLVLKSCEMAERGFITIPDRLFLIGFCLVGFQQTAFSSYFQFPLAANLFPHAVRISNIVNLLGTTLVIGSLMSQASNQNMRTDASISVTG